MPKMEITVLGLKEAATQKGNILRNVSFACPDKYDSSWLRAQTVTVDEDTFAGLRSKKVKPFDKITCIAVWDTKRYQWTIDSLID